MSPLPWNCRK
ncbi:hypothetical protein THAOC_06954, partial [Thalassiosira oceanica]